MVCLSSWSFSRMTRFSNLKTGMQFGNSSSGSQISGLFPCWIEAVCQYLMIMHHWDGSFDILNWFTPCNWHSHGPRLLILQWNPLLWDHFGQKKKTPGREPEQNWDKLLVLVKSMGTGDKGLKTGTVLYKLESLVTQNITQLQRVIFSPFLKPSFTCIFPSPSAVVQSFRGTR